MGDPAQVRAIEILLSVAGAIIIILLGIIGFWIQKWIKSTEALTDAIQNLRILYATTTANIDEIQKHCDSRCINIDIRLEEQTKSLQKAITDIAVLQQILRYNEG